MSSIPQSTLSTSLKEASIRTEFVVPKVKAGFVFKQFSFNVQSVPEVPDGPKLRLF
jgi:hypothetical protein